MKLSRMSFSIVLLTLACRTETSTVDPQSSASASAATASPGSDAPPSTKGDDAKARLAEILASPHRSADNRARDGHRHPGQTLAFFGVQPEHTVIELWPGGGWYTEILAPYVRDRGQLYVTIFDPNGPAAYYGTAQAKTMLEQIQMQPDLFGQVQTITIPTKIELGKDGKVAKNELQPFELGAPASADVVLTFRNSHGWFSRGVEPMVYGAAFRVLKPGGVFGVVQHRAAPGSDPAETAKGGYLPEASVIAAAEAVGFRLAERSEINANPKDTRDHPGGVWALPPSLGNGDADRDKYVAIGESDRMTLKFVKP